MQYELTKLEERALQNNCEVNSARGKNNNTLKNRALREEEQYRNYIYDKRKEPMPEDFASLNLENNPSIPQNASGSLKSSDQRRSEKVQLNNRSDARGLPPLYKCAELLKERVHLITYGDSLYYYNGKCYDIVVGNDIISLYRTYVDDKVGSEKNLSSIGQLNMFLCTDSTIAVKEFAKNLRIAVLNNGIYDVMDEKLRPHTHKNVVFSYINADYVEYGQCPSFDKFLYSVTEGDEALQKRLWMMLGYILMQSIEAKVFFVMGEAPDSGKSLLGNFIESLFPKKYVSNIALADFNRGFSLAPIVGSAINISLDLPATHLNATAVSKLKMLTGGDSLNINQKYVPEFKYQNRAKLIFASNFPITLTDADDAFWNRLIYLPFNRSVPKEKQDRTLPEKFQKEKNAIVSKALLYAKKLILDDFQFPTTYQIDRRMLEWQGRNCFTIDAFISDCCICGENKRGETVDNLYKAYEVYCDDTSFMAETRYTFKRFLEEQVGLKHFKMRDGGENPQSAFRGIEIQKSIK